MTPAESPEWWATSPTAAFFTRHRAALSLLGTLTLTLSLAGGLIISSLSARWGLLVFGSDPRLWVAGEQIALRVEARALGVGERVALINAVARLSRPGASAPDQPLQHISGAHFQGTLQLPREPGAWTLVVEGDAVSARGAQAALIAEGAAHLTPESIERVGERIRLTASLEVDLRASPSPLSLAWEDAQAPDLLTPRDREEEGAILTFPADQRLSFTLPSDLIIMALNARGEPLKGVVRAQDLAARPEGPLEPRGAPERLTLDPHGLALTSRVPLAPTVDIEVSLSGEPEPELEPELEPTRVSARERHWPEAHQFTLKSARRRVRAGDTISLNIKSTAEGSGLFLDLWCGARWLGGWVVPTKGGEGQHTLTLPHIALPEGHDSPDAPPPLLWVQIYKSPYLPGEVRGGAYLLYQGDGVSDELLATQLTRALQDLIITQRHEGMRWPKITPTGWLEPLPLRLALGRIARPKADPALIIDSGASAAQTLTHTKARYQRGFLTLMSGLCALLLGVIAWLMRAHHHSVLASLAAHPDSALLIDSWSRVRWFVPVALIIGCFFGGLMFLVMTIRW